MKLNKFAPKRNAAQAMVEFAIVLPILLMLLYGLLEAGRLLFIYSTIVTASRQAVRYGAATGDGTTAGVPRYQDCAGIRLAAQKVDFLNAFDDNDIFISWDNLPGDPGPHFICDGSGLETAFVPTESKYRLIVTVEGDFNPIIPKLLGLFSRSNNDTPPDPITATSARTILVSVPIEMPAAPGGPPGPGPTGGSIALSVTSNTPVFDAAGQIIHYTYTLTNTGAVDVAGPFLITADHGTTTCAPPDPFTMAASPYTCSGDYTIQPADVTAGTVTNTGTATSSLPAVTGSNTITLANPAITFTKTADREFATQGDTVNYTFVVTNSGNVPLSAVAVSDPKLGGTMAGCSVSGTWAVGASKTCTASYRLGSGDIVQSTLVNTATATATYTGATTRTITGTSSVTIYTPALFIIVSAPASVNAPGPITYTYHIYNNTRNTNLSSITLFGGPTSNCPTSLNSGKNTQCTGTYQVTQPQIDANVDLTNDIYATATAGNGGNSTTTTSNTVHVVVDVVTNASLSFVQATASPLAPVAPATAMLEGQVINYTYVLKNTGNVTLTSFTITGSKIDTAGCTFTSLAPLTTTTTECTGRYTVSNVLPKNDLTAGSFTSQATASATFPATGQILSATGQSLTVITYQNARLGLVITAAPSVTAGVPIAYDFKLVNTGGVALVGPFTVTIAPKPLSDTTTRSAILDCTAAGPVTSLAIGATSPSICSATYTTTSADVAVSPLVLFTATAQAPGTTPPPPAYVIDAPSVTVTP